MKKFDFNTIENFDEHIEKSIPSYGVLLDAVLNISDYFITEGETIYDIGCSTGKLLTGLKCDNRKIGYDNSALLPKSGKNNAQFINCDLNGVFEIDNACLVYSIFTLQFLKRSARNGVLQTIYDGLNQGGAFIVAEKTYRENGMIQEMMTLSYYQHKEKCFRIDEIISKERDLRKIMKPNTLSELQSMLAGAGFRHIEQFWQSYNFVGLICIK